MFIELLDKMKETHIAKSAGYAGAHNPDPFANFREAERFGVGTFKGVLVRMADKFTRLANLVKDPKNDQVGETIEDTLLDLASYALIAICLWREDASRRV